MRQQPAIEPDRARDHVAWCLQELERFLRAELGLPADAAANPGPGSKRRAAQLERLMAIAESVSEGGYEAGDEFFRHLYVCRRTARSMLRELFNALRLYEVCAEVKGPVLRRLLAHALFVDVRQRYLPVRRLLAARVRTAPKGADAIAGRRHTGGSRHGARSV